MGQPSWRQYHRPQIPLQRLEESARQGTDKAKYDVEVEEVLDNALSAFNDRDVESINKHLETIENALSSEIDGSVELTFGGSVSKHTYVNGISDVDMLVCLNDTSLGNKSVEEVMHYFEQKLRDRLPNTVITKGDLAITVKFSDEHQIQLLPAVRTASGYRIIDLDSRNWSNVIAPERFARKLSSLNQARGGKVVPVIKLYKQLNDSLPKQIRLSGYHIESLAIDIFEKYGGRQTKKEMLTHFCAEAQSRVLSPIGDSTGQSRHVDDKLGEANSNARRRASKAIENLLRKIRDGDDSLSTDVWEELLS